MKKSSHSSSNRGVRSSSNFTRGSVHSKSRSRARAARVNPEWLKDFFSEMLAVERGGIQLYEKALENLAHEDLRSKLEHFHQETERHVELCEQLLDAAGGDENNPGPGAEAAEHKAHGLLTAEVPEEMVDINNIENLVLAETKDNWNWEMLGLLIDKVENGDLKKMASRAVREVRKQESSHLAWSQKTLTQLVLEAAQRNDQMETSDGTRPKDLDVEGEEAEAAD